MLDNGPLRSTFQLMYNNRMINGVLYNIVKTISIDRGSWLNKIDVTFNNNTTIPVAVGIVKTGTNDIHLLDRDNGILALWPPAITDKGSIGVGVILPSGITNMKVAHNHVLAKGNVPAGQTFTYYTGATWNKAGETETADQWFTYLRNFSDNLKMPLKVVVN